MAKIGVGLKINLNSIDMARVFQGEKGQYLDATVFINLDELDQHGNSGMITQDVSKEERQQQVQGAILGNCKVFWKEGQQQSQQQGGFQQRPPQQQGGFQQNQPGYGPGQQQKQFNHQQQQQPPQQGGFNQQQPPAQQGGYQQQAAPKVNPQEPVIDFNDDIPY